MRYKSLLLTGALALVSVTIGSAKSYDIMFNEPTQAGPLQLKSGEYKVKVDGSNAIFTSVDSGKTFTAPVKIENTGKKHEQTTVDTNNASGASKLQAIELGGSDETLEFGE